MSYVKCFGSFCIKGLEKKGKGNFQTFPSLSFIIPSKPINHILCFTKNSNNFVKAEQHPLEEYGMRLIKSYYTQFTFNHISHL